MFIGLNCFSQSVIEVTTNTTYVSMLNGYSRVIRTVSTNIVNKYKLSDLSKKDNITLVRIKPESTKLRKLITKWESGGGAHSTTTTHYGYGFSISRRSDGGTTYNWER
jgi:hypothetical protein